VPVDEDDENSVPHKVAEERSFTPAEMTEAFLQDNAKPKFISKSCAAVLLHLMRAVAVKGDYLKYLGEALLAWKFLWELIARHKEPLDWREVFGEAIEDLRHDDDAELRDPLDEAYREAARVGMSLYINRARAGGFESLLETRFREALRRLDELRDQKRKEREREHALSTETIGWKARSEHGDEVTFSLTAEGAVVMVQQASNSRSSKGAKRAARRTPGLALARLSPEDAVRLAQLLLSKYTAEGAGRP
jgi:hypothetical protein